MNTAPNRQHHRLTSRQLTVIAFCYSAFSLMIAAMIALRTIGVVNHQANAAFRTASIQGSLNEGFILFGLMMIAAAMHFCAGLWHAHLATGTVPIKRSGS